MAHKVGVSWTIPGKEPNLTKYKLNGWKQKDEYSIESSS